jgi:hypothetical protein
LQASSGSVRANPWFTRQHQNAPARVVEYLTDQTIPRAARKIDAGALVASMQLQRPIWDQRNWH